MITTVTHNPKLGCLGRFIRGDTEEVLRIPFWYSHEAGSFESFAAEVQRAATKLADCYAYWPDGYIHVQTRITKEYVNGI